MTDLYKQGPASCEPLQDVFAPAYYAGGGAAGRGAGGAR
jgi:hypothetical protein